jgi:uncharacterized repeat protein (TIGR01451 family)
MKKYLFFLVLNLYVAGQLCAQTTINIVEANDDSSDYCTGSLPYNEIINLDVRFTGYSVTDTFTLQAFFGDGTYQTQFALPVTVFGQIKIWGIFSHTYLNYGSYDVTYIATGPDGNSDSLTHIAEVVVADTCASVTGRIYVDINNNCINDAGDSGAPYVPIALYNGTSCLSYTSTDALGYYNFYGVPATNLNVTLQIPSSIAINGYSLSCPASGTYNFNLTTNLNYDFAVICNSNHDLMAQTTGYYKLGNTSFIGAEIINISCQNLSGTYSLILDPRLSFVNAMDTPVLISGDTLIWNYSNLGGYSGGLWNGLHANMDASVQIGDTLCNTISALPLTNDINPVNNIYTDCNIVVSAWDPNYKRVSPEGIGITGSVPSNTEFIYTVAFQNTGNAPAQDINIIDTLDADLDINSIQVLFASHAMNYYIIDGSILIFSFTNIQLPDSGSNQMASHGSLIYKANCKPGLINGTQIKNTASIYFDSNLPVITNTTLNTINIGLGIKELSETLMFIFPNPVTDKITIQFEKQFDGTIELNDLSERRIFNQKYKGLKFTSNLTESTPGMYVMIIRTLEGAVIKTEKIIKE